MKRKNRVYLSVLFAMCFIFTLFTSSLWILSIVFYVAAIFTIFKFDRSDKSDIDMLFAVISTAITCCILLSFDNFFSVGCYLIAVMIAMACFFVFSAKDKHESWKRITIYALICVLLVWIVSRFFVNAATRIRQEKFDEHQARQQIQIMDDSYRVSCFNLLLINSYDYYLI